MRYEPDMNRSSIPPGREHFASTHWSVVVQAGHRSSVDAQGALAALCQIYWRPLYAYARRKCQFVEEAQDLTQEFFLRLVERNTLAGADKERGRFRWYLLGAFKHFLANEWQKAKAEKRGGKLTVMSLEFETAEQTFKSEPADNLTPEQLFERQWALTFLERVIGVLREEYAHRDKVELFDSLKSFMLSDQNVAAEYEAAGRKLGMSAGAVKVAASRLRDRFKRLFRQEVGHTVASEEELQDEGMRLLQALRGKP